MTSSCLVCRSPLDAAFKACPRCGSAVSEFARQYAHRLIGGNYELESFLARGGMGEVYRARHVHLTIPCVIKVMRAGIGEEAASHERFVREARLARRIRHRNVALLYDFSALDDGTYYMVWELIDGPTVAQVLQRDGALQAERALRWAIGAAEGLDAIHRAGIVHRDISPDNILIAGDEPKIIDLGIAKGADAGSSHTATGVFVGKLRYASPEQLGALADEERIDGRSDLYSLGLVLYEMLAGKPAFVATSAHRYFAMQLHETPPPLALDHLPQPARGVLLAALTRATAKNRDARPQSAREFAEMLQSILSLLDGTPPALTTTEVVASTPSAGPTTSPEIGFTASTTMPVVRQPSRVTWWAASVAALLLALIGAWSINRKRDIAAPASTPTESAGSTQAAVISRPLPTTTVAQTAPQQSVDAPATDTVPVLSAPIVPPANDRKTEPPPRQSEVVTRIEPVPEPTATAAAEAPEPLARSEEPLEPPAIVTNRAEADLRAGTYSNWRRRVNHVRIVQSFNGSAYPRVLIAPLQTGDTQVLPEPANDMYGYRQASLDLLGTITSVFTEAYHGASGKTVESFNGNRGSGSLLIEVEVVRLQTGDYVFNVIGPTFIEVRGRVLDAAWGTVLLEFEHSRRYSPALPGLTWNKRPKILKEKTQQVAADIAALVDAF